MKLNFALFTALFLLLAGLSGCGGCGHNGTCTAATPAAAASGVAATTTTGAVSGVAQGPLASGSTATTQEVAYPALTPASASAVPITYTINSALGTFSAASSVSGKYIDLRATGNYFDETTNAVSTGPVVLNGLNWMSPAGLDTVLNVNILTTLAYQRIKTRISAFGESFQVARQNAEQEVLNFFNIRDPFLDQNGNPINFGSLDLAKGGNNKGGDGDNFLAAISSLFVFGNSYDQVSALMSSFQSDIADNGCIDSTVTQNTLTNSASSALGVNPATVASNLTSKYSTVGTSFLPADISNWLDQDNDGVIGKFKFHAVQAVAGKSYTFPAYIVGPSDDGATYSVTNGTFTVNSSLPTASMQVHKGDSVVVTRTPALHDSTKTYLTSSLKKSCVSNTGVSLARYDFNPFATVASLTTARTYFTTTVLQNGQVLVAGGFLAGAAPAPTPLAELYNPVTNQWTPAGSMIKPRAGHTATLLNNGQVLAVGGVTDGTGKTTPSAELYDPVLNTWTAALTTAAIPAVSAVPAIPASGIPAIPAVAAISAAPAARAYHTATLLNDGTVLVAGGLVSDGKTSTAVGTSELYDPQMNSFTPIASSMSTPRYNSTATLLNDGTVLVVGGINGYTSLQSVNSVDVYTPASKSWSPAGTGLMTGSYSHSATLRADGLSVLIVGGNSQASQKALSRVEICTANGCVTQAHGLGTGRFRHIAVPLNDGSGAVLVAGGTSNNNSGGTLKSAELYDGSSTWNPTGNLAYPRDSFGAAMLNNGTVLLVGGQGVNAAETFK